jgi:hypothetical protein
MKLRSSVVADGFRVGYSVGKGLGLNVGLHNDTSRSKDLASTAIADRGLPSMRLIGRL